jgi:hypothetical protein
MSDQSDAQYSLAKILGIWAAAAVPMAVLSWMLIPALAPDFETDPLGSGVTRVALMTLGLAWQFALAMLIVYCEENNLRWTTVQRRLRLNSPLDPKTGERRARLWLWVIPFLIAVALIDVVLGGALVDLWVSRFPFSRRHPALIQGRFLGRRGSKPS